MVGRGSLTSGRAGHSLADRGQEASEKELATGHAKALLQACGIVDAYGGGCPVSLDCDLRLASGLLGLSILPLPKMQQPVVVDASAVYYGRVPIRPLSVILGLGDLDRIATGYAVFATIFAIVGFFTMIYSATIPLNVRMLIGWLLLIAGVMTALLAIYSYGTPGYIPLFLLATAHIFFGAIMLSDMSGHGDKVANVATIAPWFFAQGILKVLLASALRCFSTWPLVFVSGMISITLGTAVWTTYPAMEQWVIGVLVGADLVITALTLGFTACMASYGYALISSQDDDDEAGACPT